MVCLGFDHPHAFVCDHSRFYISRTFCDDLFTFVVRFEDDCCCCCCTRWCSSRAVDCIRDDIESNNNSSNDDDEVASETKQSMMTNCRHWTTMTTISNQSRFNDDHVAIDDDDDANRIASTYLRTTTMISIAIAMMMMMMTKTIELPAHLLQLNELEKCKEIAFFFLDKSRINQTNDNTTVVYWHTVHRMRCGLPKIVESIELYSSANAFSY